MYVDEFIKDKSHTLLGRITRVALHGIHAVSPPSMAGHIGGKDPILLKKLKRGNAQWHHEKEILGFLVNGKKPRPCAYGSPRQRTSSPSYDTSSRRSTSNSNDTTGLWASFATWHSSCFASRDYSPQSTRAPRQAPCDWTGKDPLILAYQPYLRGLYPPTILHVCNAQTAHNL
jgi:hypothetical protein